MLNVQDVPPLTAEQFAGLLATVVPNVAVPIVAAPCLAAIVSPCVP